jgi:hypothetical protein
VTECLTFTLSTCHTVCISAGCPKSLEPMEILIIFIVFIYRLKLKIKRLKMAFTLDERVEIVLLSGRQVWYMLLKSEMFVTLGRKLQTVLILSIPIC